MGGRRPLTALVAAVAAIAAAGCTSTVQGRGAPGSAVDSTPERSTTVSAAPSTTPSSSSSPGASGCPGTYAAPDPKRPHMTLAFDVAADLAHVTGTEQVTFTPDKPITELVFRLTANTIPTVQEGNSVRVTSASADHGGGKFTISAAGADPSTQGGLLHIPFAQQIAAGTTVHAQIAFELTLGNQSFDRFGHASSGSAEFGWFGSGEPLLAWERGYGWHTEDMIRFPAESATSEAMDVSLSVTAPAGDSVVMSGDPATPSGAGSTRTWTSMISTARDVSVAVGPFSTTDVTVSGVKLHLGAYSQAERDRLLPEFERAIRELVSRYGPFPFPSLSVARLPASGGGIEYPSSILMLDGSRLVAVHETSHQYFYAMVGDSQAQHPWLDEAFAQFSEELIDDNPEDPSALNAPGAVDRSTESYGDDEQGYYFTTYNKGAAALEAARNAAGPAKFDAALRCYVAANAWRIVHPSDFEHALAGLPAAVRVLRQAGAVP